MATRIKTFSEFYTYYLAEHKKLGTRILHFLGTLLVFAVIFYVIKSEKERFLWYLPIFGYGFPGLGHAIFEKNKPVTFKYPIWNLIADFRMFFELLIGRQKFKS